MKKKICALMALLAAFALSARADELPEMRAVAAFDGETATFSLYLTPEEALLPALDYFHMGGEDVKLADEDPPRWLTAGKESLFGAAGAAQGDPEWPVLEARVSFLSKGEGEEDLYPEGWRKIAADFSVWETGVIPADVFRMEPVDVRAADGDAEILAVLEDEADTPVGAPRAATIAASALAEGYGLTTEDLSGMEADVMLLRMGEDEAAIWVVNLTDAETGFTTDYAAQVNAETGEILWIAGPGEGNG